MPPKPRLKKKDLVKTVKKKKPTKKKKEEEAIDKVDYDSDESDKMLNFEEGGSDAEKESENNEEIEEQVDDELDDDDNFNDEVEVDDEDHDLEDHDQEDSDKESEDDIDDKDEPCLFDTDDEDDEDDGDDDVVEDNDDVFVDPGERRTKPMLMYNEYVRCVETRTEQIMRHSKKMIKGGDQLRPEQIAKLEVKLGSLPLKIIRRLPDGRKEKWDITELERDHIDYGLDTGR